MALSNDTVFNNMEYPTYNFNLYFIGMTIHNISERVYHENRREKWDIPWCTMTKFCTSILHHFKEKTLANTVHNRKAV